MLRFRLLRYIRLLSGTLGGLFLAAAQAGHGLPVGEVQGPLSVMVLGSGGPMATPSGRASAGYLVFVDGRPRILMDAGGGTFQRIAASGANLADLDIILLSHLHIDHVGDLTPIVKTIYFHARRKNIARHIPFPPGRTRPIRIFGPGANGILFPAGTGLPEVPQYPATHDFVGAHFDAATGTDRYLHVFTRAISGGLFKYEAKDLSPDWKHYAPQVILDEGGLVIRSVGVNHGPVPAVAFRIEYKGHAIVYSGDTSSRGDNMTMFARNADLLIYDTSITDTRPAATPNDRVFFGLHTTPTRMGMVAAAAHPRRLLLSHLTPITEPRLGEVRHLIRQAGYRGEIEVAHDLEVCNTVED